MTAESVDEYEMYTKFRAKKIRLFDKHHKTSSYILWFINLYY